LCDEYLGSSPKKQRQEGQFSEHGF
jgi:hypothetical protein